MLPVVCMNVFLQIVIQLQFLSSFSKLLQSCVTMSPNLIGQMDTLKQLISALVAVLTLDTRCLGLSVCVKLSHRFSYSIACKSGKYILELLPYMLGRQVFTAIDLYKKIIPSPSLSSNSPSTMVRAS